MLTNAELSKDSEFHPIVNIRVILKPLLIVTMQFRSPYFIKFFCNIIFENYFFISVTYICFKNQFSLTSIIKSCQKLLIVAHKLLESLDVPAGCGSFNVKPNKICQDSIISNLCTVGMIL